MAARSASKANTTSRGLGWRHQQEVARLFRRLVDGSPCWWCGMPMYRTDEQNWDQRKLAGDHSIPRARMSGTLADRLLHSTCNGQRGDGKRDHLRPVLTGSHPGQWRTASLLMVSTEPRLMAWP